MTLTYRGAGAWGAGKGARLTAAEFDGNTYEFDTRLDALEAGSGSGGDNPLVDITVSGSTITKFYADSTTGVEVVSAPFAAPIKTVTGASYTLLDADAGNYIRCTNAGGCMVTVSPGLVVGIGSEWHFRQGPSCPSITFVEDTTTINGVDGFDIATDTIGATVTLKLVDTDEYDLFGLLAIVT